MNNIQPYLGRQISAASLAFFRIAFGAIMFWEVCRYFHYGWIYEYYIAPDFHFHYWGFEWLDPWQGNGMYLHFIVLGALALMIMLGFFYRVVATLFFLGFTYVFLLDQANYLNHFYLISLVSFLLIFVPAHRNYSIDAALRPKISSDTIPIWSLWLIQFQIGVAYFYGGIAKINHDWLSGEPMRMWLEDAVDFPIIGPFFTTNWMPYFFSYSGLLLDLLIVPALLWKRTRLFAFIAITLFHLTNAQLFQIGIFPWMMIAVTTIFFEPDWCGNILSRFYTKPSFVQQQKINPTLSPAFKWTACVLGIYITWQVLFPFRHLLIPSNVHWTDEGHNFSWHMKLRDKASKGAFYVKNLDTDKAEWKIRDKRYLSTRQRSKMRTRPDMILKYAHHLRSIYQKKGYENIQVRAELTCSLNGRPSQFLVDPLVNLATIESYEMPATWINPLSFTLEDGEKLRTEKANIIKKKIQEKGINENR
ncbi:MAG: HTTM domain-containing protein [Saprospiraceae bacterium]